MISALLLDFGGTLDSDGQHWLDRFYVIYARLGLSHLQKSAIKEAFYWADEQAEHHPESRSWRLREMMDMHVRWQFQKLGLKDPSKEAEASAAFTKPCDRILHRNRHILEKIHHSGIKLGIISNFYGNVETLCNEFGYSPYLSVILDSAVVGLRKPDPKIFEMALPHLKTTAERVGFVGDSYERDILPAKALGMTTFWMVGEDKKTSPDFSKVDHVIHSLEELLDLLANTKGVPL